MSSRIFLLSPASTSGKRAELLLSDRATFDLAARLRDGRGAPIGEVFSFISALYFRGKLTYARTFASSTESIRVITSDRGLVSPDEVITLQDIKAMSGGMIDGKHLPYREKFAADARALAATMVAGSEVVLLGSIATEKYVGVLAEVFEESLVFPGEFVGRGDMSRGGLLLRCAREGRELDYSPVMTTIRRGTRPARLPRLKRSRAAALPVPLDYEPMEAKPVTEIPEGPEWQYEPKWDGFRCVAFRDGKSVTLMSKSGKPLTRYFPEVVAALLRVKAEQFVLDGEIVIPEGESLTFDALLQRIHPAASRIAKLSEETPAVYLVFDLLVDDKAKDFSDRPLTDRRTALERIARQFDAKTVRLSPATTSIKTVQHWFAVVGSGLDGIIAKRRDLSYQSGNRDGMQKLKHRWTADCVVGGFRYASAKKEVGSLLLGLYNTAGKLDHVGFLSGIKSAEKKALTKKLEGLIKEPGFTGKAPGGPSRWSTGRSAEWEPLAPKLVIEVEYDHFTNGRFRHGTSFVRWRPDKKPRQCTLDQLPAGSASALALIK